MPARAYWTGQIRLALVSIPVQLYSATKSAAKVSFNQIHKPTGKRIRYEKVVPGVGHDGGAMTAVAVRLLFDPAGTGEVDTRGLVDPGGASTELSSSRKTRASPSSSSARRARKGSGSCAAVPCRSGLA